MGHCPRELLASGRIDPDAMADKNQLIPYRHVIALLESTAEALNCPDFGMQLARRQFADGILGPLDIAMRNSPTVGEAWQYCANHVHCYSTGTSLAVGRCPDSDLVRLRFEVVLDRVYHQRQVVEHALLLSQLATRMFSGGVAAAREVWFTHDPLEGARCYEDYFGCPVRFAKGSNALIFEKKDFDARVAGQDEGVLEMARFFIASRFPAGQTMITTKVRMAIEQKLTSGNCTQADVAAALGMHARTLQRRLKDEDVNFEVIKDNVRRDAAVRYLRQTALPLKVITGLLGYSELSVFYRSCHRWFGASPNAIRQMDGLTLLEERPPAGGYLQSA